MASILKPTRVRLSMLEAECRGNSHKYSLTSVEGYAMLKYLNLRKHSDIPFTETEKSYEKRLKVLLNLDREEIV